MPSLRWFYAKMTNNSVLAQFVIPAKAGIQILYFHCTMDAHFRGHDIFFLKLIQHQ